MALINEINISQLSFPTKRHFSNHVRVITHINGLEIRIFTNMGIIGHGFVYGLGDISYNRVMENIENDLLKDLLEHNNLFETASDLKSHWDIIWLNYKNNNSSLEKLYALTAVDLAIWDIFTKEKKISLHQYLGSNKSEIPAYGTSGWLSLSSDELIDECNYYANKGVNAFKIRLGHPDDYSRVSVLRNAMGSDFMLMLDANQRYTVEKAVEVSDNFSGFGVIWLEEPTSNSLEELKRIKELSKIPIAMGETVLEESDFIKICEGRLTDYLQLDVPRCGGITGFLRIAQIAKKYHIPVCNHLLHEVSVGLIASLSNGYMLEYDNFLPDEVLSNPIIIQNGKVQPAKVPGIGVELTRDALNRYTVCNYTVTPRSSPCVRI